MNVKCRETTLLAVERKKQFSFMDVRVLFCLDVPVLSVYCPWLLSVDIAMRTVPAVYVHGQIQIKKCVAMVTPVHVVIFVIEAWRRKCARTIFVSLPAALHQMRMVTHNKVIISILRFKYEFI